METPLFFKNKNYKLFGVLHQTDSAASSLKAPSSRLCGLGIVFCHPFAEEKLIAHRVMVNLARRLAERGIHCLRFDYMGHGDSDGNFEDATVETRLSDIRCAVDLLKTRTKVSRIGLLGIRFGATLAALAVELIQEIDDLVLISPVTGGKAYIEQCLRSNLTTQVAMYKKVIKDRKALINDLLSGKVVNVDGYLLTTALYEQISMIDLAANNELHVERILIVQISVKQNQKIDEGLKRLHLKYQSDVKNSELINIKEHYFWSEGKTYEPEAKNVEDAITKWLFEG